MRTSRLRVSLRDVSPPVVRVIDVPAASTLPELHELLQAALGWTDSHLHQFIAGETRYGVPDPDWDDDLNDVDETTATLRDLPTEFVYLYDFGDYWEHDVEILGSGGDRPACVDGHGGCPPEDCGGTGGYEELLAVLADPAHEEHSRTREWAGTLHVFDLDATDLLLRQTVGEVPASVRLVLDLLTDGVKLTPGGRLPRVIVRQVQEHRPQWCPLGGPASIEEDLYPLSVLHDILRKVRLLRPAKGVLRATKAACDDLEIIRRLRSWFEPDAFTEILAGVTVATLEVFGPLDSNTLAAKVHPMLGRRWSIDGRPLTTADVRTAINRLGAELEAPAVLGVRIRLYYTLAVAEMVDLDALDEEDPFEIDNQAAHLFKHPHLGVEDIYDVWTSDPLFYPAKPPADWLMVAEVAGEVLMVPLAAARSGDPARCRPIGCYPAAEHLATRYRRDR